AAVDAASLTGRKVASKLRLPSITEHHPRGRARVRSNAARYVEIHHEIHLARAIRDRDGRRHVRGHRLPGGQSGPTWTGRAHGRGSAHARAAGALPAFADGRVRSVALRGLRVHGW